eukprot:3518516-Rhodomonas_salina.2
MAPPSDPRVPLPRPPSAPGNLKTAPIVTRTRIPSPTGRLTEGLLVQRSGCPATGSVPGPLCGWQPVAPADETDGTLAGTNRAET